MSRLSLLSAPFMLGFDSFEERIDQMAKSADGYPPYNIERLPDTPEAQIYQITIAVAGFARDEIEITFERDQIKVSGCHKQSENREFLHRGIATRQFKRNFLLADGMNVTGATLKDGMLMIDVERPRMVKPSRKIEIRTGDAPSGDSK